MYKRLLIKLSGESLMGEIENVSKDKTKEIAQLIKEVKDAFDENKITVPYNQIDVHVINEK